MTRASHTYMGDVHGRTHRCTPDCCATSPYGLNRAPAVPHADQLRAARWPPLHGPDVAHHAGSPEPAPSAVPVPLVESGPAAPVAPEASPNPALLCTRSNPDKVGPGECAVRTVRIGERLRQTPGRRVDRSDRTVFRLLCEDPGEARCVDWKPAVGGVYEGDFERVLSGYGSATPRPVATLASNGIVRILAASEHWCTGWKDEGGQIAGAAELPHHPRISAEPPGLLAAAAAHRLLPGGFPALYREPDSGPLVGPCGPRRVRAADLGRSPGMRGAPRLVGGLQAARGRTRPNRAGNREGRRDRPRDTEQGAGCRLHVNEGRRHLLAGDRGCPARDRRCDRPGAGRAQADGTGR